MNLTPQPDPLLTKRWRDLRGMLIEQLEAFETGNLTLIANHVDISAGAVSDLKRRILEFDSLILGGA